MEMEISDLLKPAEKRLDLTEIMGKNKLFAKIMGKEEFVTLRRFPAKMKGPILWALQKCYNMQLINKLLKEENLEDTGENITKVIFEHPEVKTAEYDNSYEHDMLSVEAGIDPIKHSFTSNGKERPLDRVFFESLKTENSRIFNFILKAVNDYQAELDLGE